MNCKPGDMAIAIKTVFGNNTGKIVLVIAPDCDGFPEMWMVELPGVKGPRDGLFRCFDSWLIPIRPGDLHETEDDLNEVSA